MSEQHQKTLINEPLSAQKLADYEAMVRESLAQQEAIEAADNQPFAEFLDAYLKA